MRTCFGGIACRPPRHRRQRQRPDPRCVEATCSIRPGHFPYRRSAPATRGYVCIDFKKQAGRILSHALWSRNHCCLLETMAETVSLTLRPICSALRTVADFSRPTGPRRDPQAEDALRRHPSACALDACSMLRSEFEDPDDRGTVHPPPRRHPHPENPIEARDSASPVSMPETPCGAATVRGIDLPPSGCQSAPERADSLCGPAPTPGKPPTREERPVAHDREWRIHLHVPLFLKRLRVGSRTRQPFSRLAPAPSGARMPTTHLEIVKPIPGMCSWKSTAECLWSMPSHEKCSG